MKCQHCGCTEFHYDTVQAIKVCASCARVEQNNIVTELSFGNNAANGFFLNQDRGQASIFAGRQGFNQDSRGLRLYKGQKLLEGIASKLSLRKTTVEAGKRYYKMAYEKNFIQGRNTSDVAGVCLYIACRSDKTPHLLIDFSDVLKVNLYKLGSIYIDLTQKLYLDVPSIDPSIYLSKFCSRLEFENKKHAVSMTALRLLQSMNRAWITTGRRPNGLCGAAILIASRYHGFKRSITQIVRVVHVCQETIRKRLDDFKQTNTAQLTREEFQAIEGRLSTDDTLVPAELEENMDPPSFTKGQCQKLLSIEGEMEDIHRMIEEKASKIEEKLGKIESPYLQPGASSIEEEKESAPTEHQLVPYQSPDAGRGVSQDIINCLSGLESSALVKRESYQTFLRRDPEGIISLSDVDDDEIDKMILTEEESQLKKVIWDNLNKEWIHEQKRKRRDHKEKRKKDKLTKKKNKKAPGDAIKFEAKNPIEAIRNSTKFAGLNPMALTSMFTNYKFPIKSEILIKNEQPD